MSSPALKIIQGLKASARAHILDASAEFLDRDRRILQLERYLEGVQHVSVINGENAEWWMAQCKASEAEVARLNDQIQSIKSRVMNDCGYFMRGECFRKHCLCAETCGTDHV